MADKKRWRPEPIPGTDLWLVNGRKYYCFVSEHGDRVFKPADLTPEEIAKIDEEQRQAVIRFAIAMEEGKRRKEQENQPVK